MRKPWLRTSDLAKAAGCHPNTVRLYITWGFLNPPPRNLHNGYRMFTRRDLDQLLLARLVLHFPYPGGKQVVLDLVHQARDGDLGRALESAYAYMAQIRAEKSQAEAALAFLERWAKGIKVEPLAKALTTRQAAKLLHLTVDMLRDWERNGLLAVKRNPHNRYRQYDAESIGRLRVIRMLRNAGYSMMSIRRMLHQFDLGVKEDLDVILDTPRADEDILYVTDTWFSTLRAQEARCLQAIEMLERLIEQGTA